MILKEYVESVLAEMPYIHYEGHDFDFEFEKGTLWAKNLLIILSGDIATDKHGNNLDAPDVDAFLDSLKRDKFFMMSFKKHFHKLSDHYKTQLKEKLSAGFFHTK